MFPMDHLSKILMHRDRSLLGIALLVWSNLYLGRFPTFASVLLTVSRETCVFFSAF